MNPNRYNFFIEWCIFWGSIFLCGTIGTWLAHRIDARAERP